MWEPKALGKFIAEAIRDSGQTQAEVAKRIGVSAASISDWTRGVYPPETRHLDALLKATISHGLVDALRLSISRKDGLVDLIRELIREEMRGPPKAKPE